jgi:hypothetical protein
MQAVTTSQQPSVIVDKTSRQLFACTVSGSTQIRVYKLVGSSYQLSQTISVGISVTSCTISADGSTTVVVGGSSSSKVYYRNSTSASFSTNVSLNGFSTSNFRVETNSNGSMFVTVDSSGWSVVVWRKNTSSSSLKYYQTSIFLDSGLIDAQIRSEGEYIITARSDSVILLQYNSTSKQYA